MDGDVSVELENEFLVISSSVFVVTITVVADFRPGDDLLRAFGSLNSGMMDRFPGSGEATTAGCCCVAVVDRPRPPIESSVDERDELDFDNFGLYGRKLNMPEDGFDSPEAWPEPAGEVGNAIGNEGRSEGWDSEVEDRGG
jgi:hypothetical protein